MANKKTIESVLKNKWLFRFLVLVPAIIIFYRIFTDQLSANPLEDLLLSFGKFSVILFLITLWISPLERILPKKVPIRILNIHKRLLGVSCFFYALIHFILYLLDQGDLETLLDNFQKPFIIIGFISFCALFILAITSFDWVVRKMRKKNWKKLHRIVYVVIFLLFLHIIAKNKGNYFEGILLFLPLVLAQTWRIALYWKNVKTKYRRPA